jgi:hypothetical protein
MSELFDTRGVKDSAEHWDALAERVASDAARQLRASRHSGVGSFAASPGGLIAASLLLAASLAFMAMTWQQASPRPAAELGQAIAPSDDVGRAIVLTGRPPMVAALLFDEPRGGGGQP